MKILSIEQARRARYLVAINMTTVTGLHSSASPSDFDAWQLAVQRHLSSLPDAQKAAFKIQQMPSLHEYQISPANHTADQYIRESQNLPAATLPFLLRPRRLRQLHRCNTSIWYFTACEKFAAHFQNLRDGPERDAYGSYCEMVYGLWNALHLTHLPIELDEHKIKETSTLLEAFIIYISSERCLRWVETAIMINYVGKWSKLLLNVETGLNIAKENTHSTILPAFQNYQNARMTFLADHTFLTADHRTGSILPQESRSHARRIPHVATSAKYTGDWSKVVGSASARGSQADSILWLTTSTYQTISTTNASFES